MEHSKIYTKKGDQGTTSTQSLKDIPKFSVTIEALGTCDELNSIIGVVMSRLPDSALITQRRLQEIQRKIFNIGALIAGNGTWGIEDQDIKQLEHWIDEIDNQLEPLTGFILPNGSSASTLCHFARAVCRRCECNIVRLNNERLIDPVILQYFNRLSDFLFVTARFINYNEGYSEQKWHE